MADSPKSVSRPPAMNGLAWVVLDGLPGTGVIVFDRDERIVAATGRLLAERGFDPRDLEGNCIRDVMPPDVYAIYGPHVASTLAGDSSSVEAPSHDRLLLYQSEMSPLHEDGEVIGGVIVSRDITDERRIEAERRDATDMFETAFSDAPMGVALIGMDGRFLRVNAALCEMLGRSEDAIVGETSRGFTHPDDVEMTTAAYAYLQDNEKPLAVEKRYLRPDGEVVWAATRGTAVRDEDGRARYIVSHFRDITGTKSSEVRREQATRRFETAFADAPIGMTLASLEGAFLKVNSSLQAITGYDEEQLLKMAWAQITHPDDVEAEVRNVAKLLVGRMDSYQIEKRVLTAKGQVIWVDLAQSVVRDRTGRPEYFIAQIQDVSERKRMEAKLQRLADQDELTGLWNRRRFQEELHRQVGRCQRYGECAALIAMDLNGFKAANDRHGHQIGDELLVTVASALKNRLRESDSIGRLGGDEFAVLLVNVEPDQAASVAEQLRSTVARASVAVGDEIVAVTASLGIAFLDEQTRSDDDAMVQADLAMYDSKAAGRDKARLMAAPTIGLDGAAPIRVVHCDDSESYRRLICEMLTVHPGIEIVGEAADAAGALAAVEGTSPDLVLLDARMQGVDNDLVDQLRHRAPGVKVVVLSGLEPDGTPLAEHADGFIPKSAPFDALASAVAKFAQTA